MTAKALGANAHAEGNETIASDECAHAEGFETAASDLAAHAEGARTSASGLASHAEGKDTVASGGCSHAEGSNTVASGEASHAEGDVKTTASGSASHAEGRGTNASGICGHAEGMETISSGNCSHAEGYRTSAEGVFSHAEGNQCIAFGKASHAQGMGAKATRKAQHAQSGGVISDIGDAQSSVMTLMALTTDATTSAMTVDGGSLVNSGPDTNVYVVEAGTASMFELLIAANSPAADEAAGWKINGIITRGYNSHRIRIVGKLGVETWADPGAAKWSAELIADATNHCLLVSVTGDQSRTIGWSARLTTAELTLQPGDS